MKKPETYIKELKNGKQLRIKYNKNHYDNSGNWWSEELICYDKNIDMFKIYFLESSYDNEYCDYLLEDELLYKIWEEIFNWKHWLNKENETIEENVETIDMILEKCNIPNTSLSMRELINQKLDYYKENELKQVLILIGGY